MSDENALQGAYNIMIVAYVLYGILTVCSVYVLVRTTCFSNMRLIQMLCMLFIVSNLSYIASRHVYYLALKIYYSDGFTEKANSLFKANAVLIALYFFAYNFLHWIYAIKFWSLARRMELMCARQDPDSQNCS